MVAPSSPRGRWLLVNGKSGGNRERMRGNHSHAARATWEQPKLERVCGHAAAHVRRLALSEAARKVCESLLQEILVVAGNLLVN